MGPIPSWLPLLAASKRKVGTEQSAPTGYEVMHEQLLQSQEADPGSAPSWRATLDLAAGAASDRWLSPVDPEVNEGSWFGMAMGGPGGFSSRPPDCVGRALGFSRHVEIYGDEQ